MINFKEHSNFSRINEGLNYSGKDVTKIPIIGQVICSEMKYSFGGKEHISPSVTYNVVEIINDENGKKYYITDKWYKENRVPLIIHEDLVEKYVPAS